MTHLLEVILTVPASLAYALVVTLVFAEAALFVGFVLPGETAVLLGGVLAATGRLSLPVLLGLVVAAAVAGDSVGFEVGRRLGPRLFEIRVLRRHRERLDGARRFLCFNVAGGTLWGVGVCMLGYVAGTSYQHVEPYLGGTSAAIIGVFVVGAIVLWHRHRTAQRRQSSHVAQRR